MDHQIAMEGIIHGMNACLLNAREVFSMCRDKEVALILGNTGSGKSVLFNYLLDFPLTLSYNFGLESVIDIQPNEDGSLPEASSPIGHTYESATLIPRVAKVHDMILCDCPGFMDNRSAHINLGHALVIREILKSASGVKIILLIEFDGLITSRGTLSQQIGNVMQSLFHDDDIAKHSASVLLVVSKIPLVKEGQPQKHVHDVQQMLKADQTRIIGNICENIVVYDPLDRPNLKITPVSHRSDLIQCIQSLILVKYDDLSTRPLVSTDDEVIIRQVCSHICGKFDECISFDERISDLLVYYDMLKCLQVLQHPVVDRAADVLHTSVESNLQTWSRQIELHLTKWNFGEADRHLRHGLKIADMFGKDATKLSWKQLEQRSKQYPFQRFLKAISSFVDHKK